MYVCSRREMEGGKKEGEGSKGGQGGWEKGGKEERGKGKRKGWRRKLKETLHTYVKAEIPLSDGDLSPLPHPPQLLHAPMLSSEAC